MDFDIERWKNKAELKNYCSECGGSGSVRTNITGNPKIDFSTCQYCKGTGQLTNNIFKASAYQRVTQPYINEFERIFSNEKDIQQPKENGNAEHFKLTTIPGIISKSRQRDTSEKRNSKPQAGGYAIPGTGGENHPVFCHHREVR